MMDRAKASKIRFVVVVGIPLLIAATALALLLYTLNTAQPRDDEDSASDGHTLADPPPELGQRPHDRNSQPTTLVTHRPDRSLAIVSHRA